MNADRPAIDPFERVLMLRPEFRGQDSMGLAAYPHLIHFFADKRPIRPADFVCGAHMAYGWMPTQLDLRVQDGTPFEAEAGILNRARAGAEITDDELNRLRETVNNSLVGASKVLHFAAPDRFAMWDSNVYKFIYSGTGMSKPWHSRISSIPLFREYQANIQHLTGNPEFGQFLRNVQQDIGEDVTPMRAVEIVIHTHGRKITFPKKKKD